MEVVSREDLAWAAKAYHAGRPLDFIASVIGVKPKKAFSLIKLHRTAQQDQASPAASEARSRAEKLFHPAKPAPAKQGYHSKLDRYRLTDEEGEFIDKPTTPYQKTALDEALISRRRRSLRRQFSRHWDMIWFQRRRGMSGRRLRAIYGDECLIWTVGGGFNLDIA